MEQFELQKFGELLGNFWSNLKPDSEQVPSSRRRISRYNPSVRPSVGRVPTVHSKTQHSTTSNFPGEVTYVRSNGRTILRSRSLRKEM